MPGLLTIDPKRQKVRDSKSFLDIFNRNQSDFLRRLVTIDERWTNHYTPESKQQAKQWVGNAGTALKRANTTISWKGYGFCFSVFQSHIVHQLFGKRKINQQWLLLCIIGSINRRNYNKMASFVKEKMHFLQDNAPAHKSIKIMGKVNELPFKLLPHPPYSPDLALSDFYLFPNLKRWLQGQRFLSNEEVKWETNGLFGGLDKSYYKRDIKMLKDRWTKCIELKGDYVEEWTGVLPKKLFFLCHPTDLLNSLVCVLIFVSKL